MKAILIVAFGLVALAIQQSSALADETCSAIRYECNLEKKEMRVSSEIKSCGSGASPFAFYDTKLAGLYDGDSVKKPIVKKCPLGTTPVTLVITGGCVPQIRVFREEPLYLKFDEGGNIETFSTPVAYAPQFGFMCGPGNDRLGMVFGEITVKLKQTKPTELFSVELK